MNYRNVDHRWRCLIGLALRAVQVQVDEYVPRCLKYYVNNKTREERQRESRRWLDSDWLPEWVHIPPTRAIPMPGALLKAIPAPAQGTTLASSQGQQPQQQVLR